MGENTKIEWAHHTFNPWRGCTKVSDGCTNCYAEKLSKRSPATLGIWGKHGTRSIAAESYWKQPLKWNRDAAAADTRHRVFCGSLMDVFEGNDTMPQMSHLPVYEARKRLFQLIYNTPNLDWLLLTKRPEMVNVILEGIGTFGGLADFKNIWLGTSVEDQKTADERIPHLLQVPAAVRWLSMEPLLGPVDLTCLGPDGSWQAGLNVLTGEQRGPHESLESTEWWESAIDWVVVGGESGPNARPMHPDWPRSIRDQCTTAGVPFLFKQWGEWREDHDFGSTNIEFDGKLRPLFPWPAHDPVRPVSSVKKLGKEAAGRTLDGRTWDELPEVSR